MDEMCEMEMAGVEMGGMMLWMLIWGLLGIALLVLAIVATVWLVRHTKSQGEANTAGESAEEILRRRYATGEIDEDEYMHRRAGLQE